MIIFKDQTTEAKTKMNRHRYSAVTECITAALYIHPIHGHIVVIDCINAILSLTQYEEVSPPQ